MRNLKLLVLAAAGIAAAALAAAPPVQTPGAAAASPRTAATPPYFSGDAAGLFAVLPPAPRDGDARDEADRRIFRETRALAGTARWQMAVEDAELDSAQMLKHFSCALDVDLAPEQAPRMVAMLQKATREAAQSMSRAKEFYKRHRPFTVEEGPTCVPASTIGESFDYPSGHTTAGWAWALVLSQVDPAHAAPILARGRAIGDSRVVCGMHNASAVENARMLTGAAIAVISASDRYQADLAAGRVELAASRASAKAKPDPQRCAVEADLARPYW